MKKLLILLAPWLLASHAFATTTACQTAALTSLLAADFTCESGALVFSNFSYSGSANGQLSSAAVTAMPVLALDGEGFLFQAPWSVVSSRNPGDAQSEESHIAYTVHRNSGLIDTLRLGFDSAVTGSGFAGVAETFCLNGDISSCPDSSRHGLKVTNPGQGFSDVAFFTGVSTISISEDIQLSSNGNGTARITGISNTFSSPEPLSFVLLGTGLLGIGLMRRKQGRR